jgi:protein-tyrosine phosphatase
MNGKWLFLALGIAAAAGAWESDNLWLRLLLASQGLCWTCLGLAYLMRQPQWFLKRPNGTLSWASWLFFWPYYVYAHWALAMWRLMPWEAAFHEIAPGVYLGRRLVKADAGLARALGLKAVLDFTCEYSEPAFMRDGRVYLCLPTLDATAPCPADLREAVSFIRQWRNHGPVYVHCALGHGRSAVAVMAWLLADRLAANADAAELFVRNKRPYVRLNAIQKAALKRFETELLSCTNE